MYESAEINSYVLIPVKFNSNILLMCSVANTIITLKDNI
jgi:hypothetical protein